MLTNFDAFLSYAAHFSPLPMAILNMINALYLQLDPENVEALVALAIMDLNTHEGKFYEHL